MRSDAASRRGLPHLLRLGSTRRTDCRQHSRNQALTLIVAAALEERIATVAAPGTRVLVAGTVLESGDRRRRHDALIGEPHDEQIAVARRVRAAHEQDALVLRHARVAELGLAQVVGLAILQIERVQLRRWVSVQIGDRLTREHELAAGGRDQTGEVDWRQGGVAACVHVHRRALAGVVLTGSRRVHVGDGHRRATGAVARMAATGARAGIFS